jgi:hypothetical protein
MRLQRAQTSACVHLIICGPMPMTMEVDLRGTSTPDAVSLTPISSALTSPTDSTAQSTGIAQPLLQPYVTTQPVLHLFIYAVFLGEFDHSLDVFCLCLVKECPIAHDITAVLTSNIDTFLYIVLHFLWRA